MKMWNSGGSNDLGGDYVTRRILAMLLTILLFTSIMPSVAGAADTPAKKPAVGGVLNLGLEQEPNSFNPLFINNAAAAAIVDQVYAGLISYTRALDPVPNLAEKWLVPIDGLSWTFTLRKGILFHDGTEMTAEDVAFTYQTIMDPAYTGSRKANVQPIKAITVVDRYAVKFDLKEPLASLDAFLSVQILSKKQFAGVAVKEMATHPASLKPVGAGPYKFVEYKPGSHVTLERNAAWFRSKELDGAPFIATVKYKVYKDWTAMYQAFSAGEVDLMRLESADATTKIRAENAQFSYERNGWGYLTLNLSKPQFADKRVRQALTYGIDRRYLVKRLLNARGVVPAGPISRYSWLYDRDLTPFPYDAVKAMELLEQAGYRMGTKGYYEKDGKPLRVTLSYVDGPLSSEIAKFSRLYWNLIGVDVELKVRDAAALSADMARGDFDVTFSGYNMGLDYDLFALFHSSQAGGTNRSRYRSPEADKLLETGRKEFHPTKRTEAFVKLQQLLREDAPVIFLYANWYTDWVSKKVKGGVYNMPGTGVTDIFRWWINEQ